MPKDEFDQLRDRVHFYREQIQSMTSFAYRQLERLNPNHDLLRYFTYEISELRLFSRNDLSAFDFIEDFTVNELGDGTDDVKYLVALYQAIGDTRGRPLSLTKSMHEFLRMYLKVSSKLSEEIDVMYGV